MALGGGPIWNAHSAAFPDTPPAAEEISDDSAAAILINAALLFLFVLLTVNLIKMFHVICCRNRPGTMLAYLDRNIDGQHPDEYRKEQQQLV